jgi:hypothetical protein
MADRLSELYQDLLIGSYDCVDRIILNAYFRMGHSAGGITTHLELAAPGVGVALSRVR